MIFVPPHYVSRGKQYSKLLLCEAPKRYNKINRGQENKAVGCHHPSGGKKF